MRALAAFALTCLLTSACDDGGGGDASTPDGTAPDGTADAGPLDATPTVDEGVAPDGQIADMGGADMEPTDMGAEMGADMGAERCPAAPMEGDGLARTTEGWAQGEADGETWLYRSVPFAAPPVGDLRWRPPAAPACYDGVWAPMAHPPACPQVSGEDIIGDEDCLYLNLWTPQAALTDGRQRPILFFIHGGGNSQGSATVGAGNQILYNGQDLAEAHDAVVIVTQYRIGALGYLTHPALAAEDPEGHSGNYGQLDLIAALNWAQANAAAFGGDPERVMIFGESAGGRNTCILVASPLAAGLFHASMMESGACVVPTRAEVEAEGLLQVEASGCAEAEDVAACMRAESPTALLTDRPPVVSVSGAGDAMKPYVDGYVLMDQPIDVIERGEHNRVAFGVGANADETAQEAPALASEAAYQALLRAQLGPRAEEVLAVYPASDFESPQQAYIQVLTDARFVCGARRAARAAALYGPAYLYLFDQALTNAPRLSGYGAYHGAELFFVFNQMSFAGYRATVEEAALAEAMGGYWARLAAGGDPNGDGALAWPAYDDSDPWMIFDGDDLRVEREVRAARCDFWDAF